MALSKTGIPIAQDSTPMFLHKVPNSAVDMDSRALPACYPRGNFWLMIFTPSTTAYRFTKFCFRNCSTYPSRSKASLCLYTTTPISIRS